MNISNEECITLDGKPVQPGCFQEQDFHRVYDIIWRGLGRENSLIDNRISWSIFLTAGYLTAESFLAGHVLDDLFKSGNLHPRIASAAFSLMSMLSFVAAWFSWRTHRGVQAALKQITYLKYFYLRSHVGDRLLFEDVLRLPRPFGAQAQHASGNETAKTYPFVILIVWVIFAVMQLAAAIVALIPHAM